MSDKIMVFIPMYNCEKQIGKVIEQFTEDIQKLFCEIVVVDNISRDNSVEVAKHALAGLNNVKTTLLVNNQNYNLGGSHKVAFNYAISKNYNYFVVLHGDNQGNIADILPYIENNEYKKYDCLLGSRFAKGSKLVGYSKFRTFGNIVFNIFCSIAARRQVTDMGAGLNLYNTEFLKSKFYLYFPNNLTFNVYMLFYTIYKRFKYKFFPLTWKEEDQVSNAKVFKQAWIILEILAQYVFAAKELFNDRENEFSTMEYSSAIIEN